MYVSAHVYASASACVGMYGHQKMMLVLPECISVYHMSTVTIEERRGHGLPGLELQTIVNFPVGVGN